MTPTISQLQEEIAETLAIEKAYNLPYLCTRLGLEEGDEQEAFSSKRVYVRRRIVGYSKEELLGLANEVLERYPSESLQNIVNLFEVGLGVDGKVKNLIFATNGPKPDILLSDSINNEILIVENSEYCLVYDLPLPENGLTWEHLVEWWAEGNNLPYPSDETEFSLYNRLLESLASPPEKLLYKTYFKRLRREFSKQFPAIIPQVYLHYDPKTVRELHGRQRLARQRMDFLFLFSNKTRIVIEVDGKQHYSDDSGESRPRKYAEMVEADRQLRLNGYEIYRFGGYELRKGMGEELVESFFRRLFKRHNVTSNSPDS